MIDEHSKPDVEPHFQARSTRAPVRRHWIANLFRRPNPDSLSALWRRQFRKVFNVLLLLQFIAIVISLFLAQSLLRSPDPADVLPTPVLDPLMVPVEEWALMDGQLFQLTPEFAAERLAAKTQIVWVHIFVWALLIATIILSLSITYRTHRSRRLRRSGHCAACGYDLHGTGELDPCPECGCSRTAAIT